MVSASFHFFIAPLVTSPESAVLLARVGRGNIPESRDLALLPPRPVNPRLKLFFAKAPLPCRKLYKGYPDRV